MIIRCTSYGRAGLLGNPSDGYYGRTISLALDCFPATVVIYESPEIHLVPNAEDQDEFASLEAMVHEIDRFGYYGGLRLLKATCRQFFRWCQQAGVSLPDRKFTLRYHTTVPQLVGLGGSSAICTATLKALQAFYEVSIPLEMQPTLCWQAECDLSISCGLQDRVIQIYNGLVYMDFEKNHFLKKQYGIYERLDPKKMPPFYVAYDPQRAEFSGIYHGQLRELARKEDSLLKEAMLEFADYAKQGREALLKGDVMKLHSLVNANFDLRRKVMPVSPGNAQMVDVARRSGASAKFAGSGGAIIGLYHSEEMFQQLCRDLQGIQCAVVRPSIAE